MYRKCPKCGHENAEDTAPAACAACGLVYAKYLQTLAARESGVPIRARTASMGPVEDEEAEPGIVQQVKDMLVYTPDEVDPLFVYARAALFVAVVIYGIRILGMDIEDWEVSRTLIHMPMVPIHEFGHVIFMPFGEFMTLLGGSLFQCGLPLIFGGIFVYRNRDTFSASLMLWWSSVAVLDVAPYIWDAQEPRAILLTGRTGENGAHDFIDVLGDLGLLTRARTCGEVVWWFGAAMMMVAFAWGAAMLWRQYQRRSKSS